MSKKNRAQRRAKKRRYVSRTERVKPSALAEAKKRPWTMMMLLERGPDNDGITAEQFEAGVQIVEAHDLLWRMLGFHTANLDSLYIAAYGAEKWWNLTPAQTRQAMIYLGWKSNLSPVVAGDRVVEWITDERYLTTASLPKLVRALDLWQRHRDDWRDEQLTAPMAGALHSRLQGYAQSPPPIGVSYSVPAPYLTPLPPTATVAPRHAPASTAAPRAMAPARRRA